MRIGIPAGGLVISLDGNPQPMRVEVSLETWPMWLRVAIEMAKRAEATGKTVAAGGLNEQQRTEQVESEFQDALTAIVASAFVLEGFSAAVIDRAPTPPQTAAQWSTNRTARHKQIGQTLRRCFKLQNDAAKNVDEILRTTFVLRNRAVHPSASLEPPVYNPATGETTHRAFAEYTAESALGAAGSALGVINHCAPRARDKYPEIVTWCADFVAPTIAPLIPPSPP